jgi:predicted nucleic acid-binding protein
VREVFTDTLYWAALVNPRDQWREQALAASQSLEGARMVTTQEVLTDFLNALASAGTHIRQRAGALVEQMRTDPGLEILPQSRETFEAGFELHRKRPDKGYSLTDCISMQSMRSHEIVEVLTNDHQFAQGGFVVLLKA